ncbi:hypothetical protein [Aeromonas veronii]|uniref:hypothetical protein n=1 Tax=Aeromonas veronii TaxID=654 RepID=UPI003D249ABB
MLEWAKLLIPMATGIIAGVVSYKAAVKKFGATTRDGDKSILVTTVTQERAVWRSELREHIAIYAKLAYEFLDDSGDITELNYHKLHIIMRLNPLSRDYNSEHAKDYAIFKSVTSIHSLCEKSNINNIRLKNELIQLEKAGQELLKQEWMKSKNEAVSGILS